MKESKRSETYILRRYFYDRTQMHRSAPAWMPRYRLPERDCATAQAVLEHVPLIAKEFDVDIDEAVRVCALFDEGQAAMLYYICSGVAESHQMLIAYMDKLYADISQMLDRIDRDGTCQQLSERACNLVNTSLPSFVALRGGCMALGAAMLGKDMVRQTIEVLV